MACERKEENRSLYSLEGIACVSVVFLHCTFPSWIGVFVCGLARFAVPLFFIVSGYYLWRPGMSQEQVEKRIRNKSRHIGFVLLASSALYLSWTIFREGLTHGSRSVPSFLKGLLQMRQLFAAFVLNDFTAIGGHLWFLAALLYGYLILGFVIRRKGMEYFSESRIYRYAAFLLSAHVIGRVLFALAKSDDLLGIPVYLWSRNWLFMGIPFMLSGCWMRENRERLLELFRVKQMIFWFILGICLTTVENFLIYDMTGDDRELYIGTFMMVFSMFLYVLRFPEKGRIRGMERIGRQYLLFIYVTHLAVTEGIDLFLGVLGLNRVPVVKLTRPLIVVALCAAGAFFWKNVTGRKEGA